MLNVATLSFEQDRALTAAFMVVLAADGLRLPGLDTISAQPKFTPVPIGLPHLLLLGALRRGGRLADLIDGIAERTGTDRNDLLEFVLKLDERRVLIDLADRQPDRSFPQAMPVIKKIAQPANFDETKTLSVATPRLFRILSDTFEHLDHEGELRMEMSAVELAAMSEFRQPITVAEAWHAHIAACGRFALDRPRFNDLLDRLDAAGLLQRSERHDDLESGPGMRRGRPTFGRERAAGRDWQRYQRLNESIRQRVRESEVAERELMAHAARKRVKVVTVQQNGIIFPLALGMIVAFASTYRRGSLNQHYVFHPDWLVRPSKIRSLTREPAVFLFSNYNWSHRYNLTISKKVKEVSPGSLTIHGGPNTPKYKADCEAYFLANPDVDITVRGEGEITVAEILAALAGTIGNGPADLSVLRTVPGLSFRNGSEIVSTPDRDRIVDLDSIPSPILTGLFDAYEGTELGIIETNRGCPYSCTFCDWGSAIGTRIRQFSLDRVFAELEWCAQHQIAGIMIADANFGIFERDVQIAEKVAQLKREYGYPNGFSVSAAKNTTKHTKQIIQILADAGVMSKGSIGVQSMDPATLKAVGRSNIRIEAYDDLAIQFHNSGLPLWVDLMFGLPGQTTQSFRNDLQGCINRGVFPRMFMTELLVNSPMNDPKYREEHRIETERSPDGARRLVVATSSFTRAEYEEMNALRLLFILGDAIGMLRHVAHYARSETGMSEVDFYDRLRRDMESDPERWPTLAFSVRALPSLLVAPVSWWLIIEEARRYLTEVLDVQDDGALSTMLTVQHTLLPARDRILPLTLQLDHDYASWHRAMIRAVQNGHRDDWHLVVPKLREFGSGSFTIDDPDQLCSLGIGGAVDGDLFGNYELRSPVARWIAPQAAIARAS